MAPQASATRGPVASSLPHTPHLLLFDANLRIFSSVNISVCVTKAVILNRVGILSPEAI